MSKIDKNKMPAQLIFSKERLMATTLINLAVISIALLVGFSLDLLFKTEKHLFLLLSIVFSFPVVIFFISKKAKVFVSSNMNK